MTDLAEPTTVTAFVGPTGHGTFGIRWRGLRVAKDYSGPYDTEAEAEESARAVAAAYGWELTIEKVPTVNGPRWRAS